MLGSDPNSVGGTSASLPPRSKNIARNRTYIGWKYGTDVLGNKLFSMEDAKECRKAMLENDGRCLGLELQN